MTMWAPQLNEQDGTKYEQIAVAIEKDIASGRLSPGDRLPAQRRLAKRLRITIGTVGRAYALAERRGLTKSEVGRGCFVAQMRSGELTDQHSSLVVDLGVNFPPSIGDNRLFEETLRDLSLRKNLSPLFGAMPVDAFQHQRVAVSKWLSPRIECCEKDVLICMGTQSALIASLASLTDPGDSVYVEAQTFPGILAAMRLLRLTPISIPMDNGGIVPDEMDGREAKVIFLNPTNQNPTSTTLNLTRRKSVARIIEKRGMWLLEDDTYGHLCINPPPTISSLIPDRSVLITSLSKSMSVGLRLAFLRAPQTIRRKIVAQLQATSFFPSTIAVEIATKWIIDGTANHLVQSRIKVARHRQQIATAILPMNQLATSPALNHVWLELSNSWNANSMCRAAEENGVIILPSKVFSPTPECETNCIRIALGGARTDEELKVGLRKIARLLDSDSVRFSTRF